MPSVRSFLESHTPLPVNPGSREGRVIIEVDDLADLEEISGIDARTTTEIDLVHIELDMDELQELANAAHQAVHPRPPQDIVDRVFGTEEPPAPAEDEVNQLRAMAMSWAVGIYTCELQANHGLDTPTKDLTTRANEILSFLKGE